MNTESMFNWIVAQRIEMDLNCEVLENTRPWCSAVFKNFSLSFWLPAQIVLIIQILKELYTKSSLFDFSVYISRGVMTSRAEWHTHPLCLLFSTQAYSCHVKPWSCVTWSEVFRVMAFKLVTVEMSFYFSCSSASQVVILSVWNAQKTHYQLLNAICNVWYSFTIYSSTQFHALSAGADKFSFTRK